MSEILLETLQDQRLADARIQTEQDEEAKIKSLDDGGHGRRQGSEPNGPQSVDLNNPGLMPPELPETSVQISYIFMRFGCIPGTRELRGTSGLDGMLCERAITTETCRHVLGIGKLAALKYESKTDRHTNSTFVKRGLYFQFSGGKFSIAQEFKSPMPGTNTADSSFEPATIGEATEDFTLSNGVIEVKGSHTGTKALRHESSAISPYVSLSLDMSAAPCSVSVPHIDRGDSKSPRYIAVGILKRRAGSTQERIRWMDSGNQMFRRVRTSALEIWPLHKRIFSLKSISGFGLYHCDFNTGHHSTIDIDGRTMKTLSEFYMDYNRNANEEHWTKWVHEKLNNESSDLKQGKYTLELILRWSPLKIILYSLLPVLGSLAVGFAYMQTLISETNSDLGTDLAVIQTAWGLASYIVGAAGVTLAILGVITQITDT